MTPNEAQALLSLVKANWNMVKETDQSGRNWHAYLEDYDYKQCVLAVKQAGISGQKEAPNPGMIIAMVENNHGISEADMLHQIGLCVSRIGSYNLPSSIYFDQRMYDRVESIGVNRKVFDFGTRFGWKDICMSEQPDVLRGQLSRAWKNHSEIASKREISHALIDSGVIKQIENTVKQIGE